MKNSPMPNEGRPSDSFLDFEDEEIFDLNDDKLFALHPDAPKRLSSVSFCRRCGCRLSQYRDPEDRTCCACNRAMNPLFNTDTDIDKSA